MSKIQPPVVGLGFSLVGTLVFLPIWLDSSHQLFLVPAEDRIGFFISLMSMSVALACCMTAGIYSGICLALAIRAEDSADDNDRAADTEKSDEAPKPKEDLKQSDVVKRSKKRPLPHPGRDW